jgi:hypothetical protein
MGIDFFRKGEIIMVFLTAAPQGDPVALVMLLCLLAFVAVLAIRKRFFPQKAAPVEVVAVAATEPEPVPQAVAPGSAGQIKLHDVEPKIAAMAMAIVADKMGKPLNELRFISIREVTEK